MKKIFILNIYYNNHQPYWEVLEALNLHSNWPLGNHVLMPPMWVCPHRSLYCDFFPVWLFPLVSHAKAQITSRSPRNPRAFRRPLCPEEFYSSNGLLDSPNDISNLRDLFKNGATCSSQNSWTKAFQGVIRLWRVTHSLSKKDIDILGTQTKPASGMWQLTSSDSSSIRLYS